MRAAGDLSSEVLFHASYDTSLDADRAKGSPTAKVVGKVEQTEGVKGKAVVVGPKGRIEYLIEDNINQGGGVGSLEMWVKPLDWSGSEPKEAIFFNADYDNEGKSPDQVGLFRLYNLDRVARLTFIGGAYPENTPAKWVTVQSEIPGWVRGEWHHLVVTWDGRFLALYVDGEQKRRAQIPVMNRGGEDPRFVPTLGRAFTVGGRPRAKAGETAIDEVTIYKTALLPEEVAQQFAQRSAPQGAKAPAPAPAPTVKTEGVAMAAAAPSALMAPLDPKTRVAIAVPILPTKPAMDGVVDEKEWGKASSANGFVEINDTPYRLGRHENRFHICVADQVLYLGLVSDFKGGAPPTAEAASNSGKIFMDDCFEVHFSSMGNSRQIDKYIINAKGQLDHYRINPGHALAPSRALVAAKVLPDKWSCELAVPLKELGWDRPASIGDKVLVQLVRAYKEGSVAQRTEAARSVDKSVPKEEYAGFPWNNLFENAANYAELTLVDEARSVKASVDLKAYFGKGELRLQGNLGSAWASLVKDGELKILGAGKPTAPEPVPVQRDGSYVLAKPLPDHAAEAELSLGGALRAKVPLHRTAATLRMDHTIFSNNNTLQVEMDLADLPGIKPSDVGAEISVRDSQGKTLIFEKIPSFEKTVEKRTVSIATLAAGKHALECALRDPSGKLVATAVQSFEVFRKLPGEGNRLGITDQTPAPWIPVEIGKNNQVTVWGRTYDFGANILPQQVISQGRPLLSEPLAYEVQLKGMSSARIRDGSLKAIEQKPGRLVLEGRHRDENVEVQQTLTIEFDGMIRCDAKVTAQKPIQRLSLKIPYKKERAKWFYAVAAASKFADQMWTVPEVTPSFKWASGYLYPCMWLTDMQAGLSWFAGSDRSWVVDRRREKLAASQEGMTINFVDTDSTDTKEIEFTYGLQAFPTRPTRADWREFGRVREGKWVYYHTPDPANELQHDGLVPEKFYREVMQGAQRRLMRALLLPFGNFPRSVKDYTDLSPEVREFASQLLDKQLDALHRQGIEFIAPYLTPTYGTDSIPEWKFYWSNWIGLPKARFDADGETKVCVANVQWRDFWLQSFHDYVRKYGIKSVHHDMSLPYAEEGKINGLGYDKNGVRYPEFPIWELREVFKRSYIDHREAFPDAMSFMNEGGNFVPPIHSFVDFVYNCERYETRSDRSIYDLDGDGNILAFTIQTSLPRGPKSMAGGWLKYPLAMNEKGPTVHLYGLVLLHDLVQMNVNENPDVRTQVHELKKRFGIGYDRDVQFLPYWENGDKYRVDSKDIVVSFYRKDSRLLAIVVSKSMKRAFEGTISLATKALGINSVEKVEVFDPMDGSYTPVANPPFGDAVQLKMEVKPTLFKAVLVNVP